MTERVSHSHDELLAHLSAGIEALTSTAAWRRHLAVQGRFHRYSYANVLLIAVQRPDATSVAGFHTWRRLGRVVRGGERALWIRAPIRARRDDEDDEPAVRGFRFVPVFDIAQTEGAALPSVCERLEGDAHGYGTLEALGRALGFRVEDHEFSTGTNGDCSHARRRIRVEARNSAAQRTKSLAHELAHAILHERADDRPRAELEAESVAYIVCDRLGLDSGSYSFGYLAAWAGGGNEAVEAIKSSCAHIQHAASVILAAFEDPATEDPATENRATGA